MVDYTLFGRFKLPDQVLYAAVFLVFFFIGIMSGRSTNMFTSSKELLPQDNLDESNSVIGKSQWNLLVIAVDQLASRPALMGIWLLVTSPEMQNLTLVPIYPAGELDPTPVIIEWDTIFSLTPEKKPNIEFLETVSEQILWDDYLIIDKDGIASIQETVTQFGARYQANEVQVNKNLLPRTGVDVDLSLEDQLEIWKTICLELSSIIEPEDLSNFITQIKPYIHTQINLDEIAHQRYFQKNTQLQLVCEFPTLALNSP
jgi:hypothetical protein